MVQETSYRWVASDEFRLPKAGRLIAEHAGVDVGWLAFRCLSGDVCELLFGPSQEASCRKELLSRVLIQARKSRYRRITVQGAVTAEWVTELESEGFEGDPLSRNLLCDAPEDLQPYLDWKGRVTQIAHGKGSETINAMLFGRIAEQLPDSGRFSEVDISRILNTLHTYGDQSGVRRELVDRGLLARTKDCREYWKVQPEAGACGVR